MNVWISVDEDEFKKRGEMYIRERIAAAREDDANAEKYRAAAKEVWQREGEIEIDPGAVVSMGDDPGAYVMGWLWVRDDQAGFAGEDETEICECQNCDWSGPLGELDPIKDISERVAAGETMPKGECPECGALAHLRS